MLAQAFADLGYRRATTAELAERCGLRENQLYRLWPNKKAMFLASIDYLYEFSAEKWRALLAQDDAAAAEAAGRRFERAWANADVKLSASQL